MSDPNLTIVPAARYDARLEAAWAAIGAAKTAEEIQAVMVRYGYESAEDDADEPVIVPAGESASRPPG